MIGAPIGRPTPGRPASLRIGKLLSFCALMHLAADPNRFGLCGENRLCRRPLLGQH
jgi:hypothetical protein